MNQVWPGCERWLNTLFRIIKRLFGYTKLHYRGLLKHANNSTYCSPWGTLYYTRDALKGSSRDESVLSFGKTGTMAESRARIRLSSKMRPSSVYFPGLAPRSPHNLH
ncbi:protein of unknown function [Methylocaldum szegediense]|uniref:Uncharacterized protein n=1 Tax=Methylocaldum szegediense TaxID=73780 RepID=A0ABM9HXU0_9GAMM|nr:protein of unknown function [Methylocaldum szegediense]